MMAETIKEIKMTQTSIELVSNQQVCNYLKDYFDHIKAEVDIGILHFGYFFQPAKTNQEEVYWYYKYKQEFENWLDSKNMKRILSRVCCLFSPIKVIQNINILNTRFLR
jgi:hypothetical protein